LVRAAAGIELHKAVDSAKDQSYFLHAVAREQLARTLMPLGEIEKGAVRERARRAGLPVFDKPDSTGICFIGERPFREFLARFLPETPGAIETPDRVRVGTHRGLHFYTLGQREGLSIGGRSGFSQAPWFVAAKDTVRNVLVVVQGHDHPLLASTELVTGGMHWLTDTPCATFRCQVKVRYRQAEQAAQVQPRPDNSARIIFDEPQRAVTPGQYAVLYDADRCIGGAVIETVASQARFSAAA
jgi:tRNA-uridine 2-sulfurtransferase